ncbi:MAG: CARDB domain-containing protein, partial [Chloroflexota bacterium]
FEAVVSNVGTATTENSVGVAFSVDGQYITFGSTGPLAAGASATVRAISPWQAIIGQHRLVGEVDDINRYPEISETNNRFELQFQVVPRTEVGLPDSIVNGIDFERDSNGQIFLTASVSNIGTATTPDVVGVAFFLEGHYLTYGLTDAMAPGTTETIRAVQGFNLHGSNKITAIVDDINRYDELSHQNNALERQVTFS